MENESNEEQKLEKQMMKLRLKLKRAMDNQKPLRLTVNDMGLLSIGFLREWVEGVYDDA